MYRCRLRLLQVSRQGRVSIWPSPTNIRASSAGLLMKLTRSDTWRHPALCPPDGAHSRTSWADSAKTWSRPHHRSPSCPRTTSHPALTLVSQSKALSGRWPSHAVDECDPGKAADTGPRRYLSCRPPRAMQPAMPYRARRETGIGPSWSAEPVRGYWFRAPAGAGLFHDRQGRYLYSPASTVCR